MTANQPIVITETNTDGTTTTITVHTNGGNFNREIKGDVIQGDYYEGGTKRQKPTT